MEYDSKLVKMLGYIKESVNPVNLVENPYAFFYYLKICKHGFGAERISSANSYEPGLIRQQRYYDLLGFRIYICELVYNAINLFPDISEYTITCKNEKGTSYLTFGSFKEHICEGHPCMGQFKGNFDSKPFYLSLQDIKSLYMANRYPGVDQETVNNIVVAMFMSGTLPKVTLSYKSAKSFTKGGTLE